MLRMSRLASSRFGRWISSGSGSLLLDSGFANGSSTIHEASDVGIRVAGVGAATVQISVAPSSGTGSGISDTQAADSISQPALPQRRGDFCDDHPSSEVGLDDDGHAHVALNIVCIRVYLSRELLQVVSETLDCVFFAPLP